MVRSETEAGTLITGEILEMVRRRLMHAYPDLLARARLDECGRESVRRAVRQILVSEGRIADKPRREAMVSALFEEIAGFGPLEPLLADPAVTEVMVNGAERVYVEREGTLEKTGVRFRDDAHVLEIIDRMISSTGRRLDLSQPYVDARLPDGSRVNAIIPPVAIDGPMLTLRRFNRAAVSPEDLVRLGTLAPEQVETLRRLVRGRLNLLVSGGAGSGKTTFLNAMVTFISLDRERLVTIEDAAELRFGAGNLVRLECRAPNIEGRGGISQRHLLRNALRMRPDRIIIGECRGEEAYDMLQAMNTGHPGSMTSIHANSPADALRRLETMVLMAGEGLPHAVVRDQVASAVDAVVHLSRTGTGRRVVSEICIVQSWDQVTGLYRLASCCPRGEASELPLTREQIARLSLFEGS